MQSTHSTWPKSPPDDSIVIEHLRADLSGLMWLYDADFKVLGHQRQSASRIDFIVNIQMRRKEKPIRDQFQDGTSADSDSDEESFYEFLEADASCIKPLETITVSYAKQHGVWVRIFNEH